MNEIWLDRVDEIDEGSREYRELPGSADGEIEIGDVHRHPRGFVLFDHRAVGHCDVHLHAEPDELTHLAQRPPGPDSGLHQVQNSHDAS